MEKATCQVCGREIKASTGLIAHHGYQRPYEGWQTSSCEGARDVSYEVYCARLQEVIEVMRNFITSQEEKLVVFLEIPPETITVSEKRSAWAREEETVYEKPENFNPDSYKSSRPRTYENAYADRRYRYYQTIKAAKADLSTMERR